MTQTLELEGRRYVLIPEDEFRKLTGSSPLLPLPAALPSGNYPALETARAIIANKIIAGRNAAGISQAELARLAGIQPANLNRIEKARVTPDESTIKKIEKALAKKGQRI